MAISVTWGRTTSAQLRRIEQIDNEYYTNDITGIDWYIDRYIGRGFAMLYDTDRKQGDQLVGYAIAVPIAKELYDAFISGVLTNDVDINPDMFLHNSEYYYLASCVIMPQYRGKGYGTQLVAKTMRHIRGQCVALAVSETGKHLASKHLQPVKQLKYGQAVFVGEVNNALF